MASDLISLGLLQQTDPDMQAIATAGGWLSGDIILVEGGGAQFILTAGALTGNTHPTINTQYTYSIVWSATGTYIAASVFTRSSTYSWTSDETVSKSSSGDSCLCTPRVLGVQRLYVTAVNQLADWTTFSLQLYINVQA